MTSSRDLGELTKNLSSDPRSPFASPSCRTTRRSFSRSTTSGDHRPIAPVPPVSRRAKNEVLASLDQMLLSVLTFLDEMSRAPRRGAERRAPLSVC
jgi:hypothetical protein